MSEHQTQPQGLRLKLIAGPPISVPEVPPGASMEIGRSHECDICMPDPTVSRRHAVISSNGSAWTITDLNSRAGTFVNVVRIGRDDPQLLAHLDLVQIGPWTFRVDLGAAQRQSATLADVDNEPGQRVERVQPHETESVARHQLGLLLSCASRTHQASDEHDLADAVLETALAGTVYHQAALIRSVADDDAVEVIASRGRGAEPPDEMAFSRSLVREASAGQMARLTQDAPMDVGRSIVQLGIAAALCAPVMLGSSVAAFLYLDARHEAVPMRPEDAAFCQAIARLCGLAMANLSRVELERRQRRLEADVAAAREAQQLIVPAAQGDAGLLRYSMHMQPGRFVAGDLFDIVPLDEHRVAVCIGDVTGEGVGAAILMAATQAYLHSGLVRSGDPVEAVTAANAYVASRSALNKFISMWVGVIDTREGMLSYVDAGHGHWLFQPASGTMSLGPRPRGLVLGVEPRFTYESSTVPLEPGDRLVLFSDGVIEQPSPDGERFGMERVAAAIRRSTDPHEDVTGVRRALERFASSSIFADDTTIASVQWTP